MRSRFQELLHDVLPDDGRFAGAVAWDQIVLVENIGRIPALVPVSGDLLWNRGFKAIVLDMTGTPAYLCKCRTSSDSRLRRETEVRASLSADARLHKVVPWTEGTHNCQLQLQLSRYIRGPLYRGLVPKLSLAEWVASVRAILDGAHLACETYAELSGDASGPLRPWEISAPFMEDLAAAGLSPAVLAAIEGCLRGAPPVQAMAQHGDLWPSNIIHDGEAWWLLDFEYFGDTSMPLYDVCHLLRTSVMLRRQAPSGAAPTWLSGMSQADALAREARDLLRARATALGLDADQTMGSLVAYMVEVTGRLLRRRAPPKFCKPFVMELEEFGSAIRAGTDLEAVFWGA